MSNLKKVFRWIEDAVDEIIDLQRELTARPALGPVNGGDGEHDKAEFLSEILAGLQPDSVEEIRAPDQKAREGYRPNLLAHWKGREPDKTVWALSHMDIVPPGDPDLWDGDPYQVRIEGDRIIGRGVHDDQQGIVSTCLAIKAVLENGLRPARTVSLGFVADEETGSRYGLEYILEQKKDAFHPEDLIIIPDAGNEEGTMIEVAEKSMLWLKFTIKGAQCHASTPEKGNNSLLGAAKLILALAELKEGFGSTNDLFKPPVSTFEPTKMEANVPNINTIPGRDVFYLDCRILPGYQTDDVIAAATAIAQKVAGPMNLSIQVDVVQRQDSAEVIPLDAEVVKNLSRAIKAVTGLDAEPRGIGGGTVAALFRKAGLPAAVWMSAPDTAHQPNEYCLISDIIKDAKIFACLYLDEYQVG